MRTQTVRPAYPGNNPNGHAITTKEARLPLKHPAQVTQAHRYKMLINKPHCPVLTKSAASKFRLHTWLFLQEGQTPKTYDIISSVSCWSHKPSSDIYTPQLLQKLHLISPSLETQEWPSLPCRLSTSPHVLVYTHKTNHYQNQCAYFFLFSEQQIMDNIQTLSSQNPKELNCKRKMITEW